MTKNNPINRARGLYVAQQLAGEIRTGRKGARRAGAPTLTQQANTLTGGQHRTKRAALTALVAELRTAYGYVPTRAVRLAVKA